MATGNEGAIGYIFFASTIFLIFSVLGMVLVAMLLKRMSRYYRRKKIKEYNLNDYELVFNNKGEITMLISVKNKNDIIYL
ncbi:MAG: hypothetical protein PHT07_10605 [Paludibacter sp.]|nr:hypothetical protein [Paludibacter sp.]